MNTLSNLWYHDCAENMCWDDIPEGTDESQIDACTKCMEVDASRSCRDLLYLDHRGFYEGNNWGFSEIGYLPGMGLDPNTIIASGFSSGSYMSMQMHVIYSETIKGVGLHQGGPYASRFEGAGGTELRPELLGELFDYAYNNEVEGLIDPLDNLNGSPVYITAGA